MDKVTIQEAIANMQYNHERAKQNPAIQKEFLAEYMYANPNDYSQMLDLYTYYGFKYGKSLWAYQQLQYIKIDKAKE